MGLGLENAYGAGGAADALRQQLRDRFERQQALHTQSIQDQELELRRQQAEQSAKIGDAQLASLSDERAARAGQAREAALTSMTGRLTPGTTLGANDASALPDYLKTSTPVTGDQSASMLFSKPEDSAPVPGTIANSPSPQARTFRYTGTDKQNTDVEQKQLRGRLLADPNITTRERLAIQMEDAGLKVPAGVFEPKPSNPLPIHDTAGGLMRPNATTGVMEPVLDAKGKPVQGYHPAPDKLTKVEHKDPTTGRTVIEWLPQSELKGKTFQKGTGGATETRLASAEAVNQTGNDIIAKLSDPAYASVVGPVMGRAGKVADWIGNPPPELSELAGAIESYSLANMGVHGMRSAQGAQLIAKLLNQPHTPESIVAAIKGLNSFSQHFMENEGRRPAGSSTTPAPAGPSGFKIERQ